MCVLARDFSRSRNFLVLQNKLLQRGSRTTRERSSPDSEHSWSSLRGKCAPDELLRSSRSMLEKIPLREILLLREILG
jgi:hypothetical protein